MFLQRNYFKQFIYTRTIFGQKSVFLRLSRNKALGLLCCVIEGVSLTYFSESRLQVSILGLNSFVREAIKKIVQQ